MELFDFDDKKGVSSGFEGRSGGADGSGAPLADRMRPATLGGFAGQEHLTGEGRLVSRAVARGEAPSSLILWGPPGCGKTTLARIIANAAKADFVEFSAVLSGVKEIREVMKRAAANRARGARTILFVDEIHRFNKAQQDSFLHSVEDGTITLIGATTENPSFEVIGPLLSRCKVLVLAPLDDAALGRIMAAALADAERGLGGLKAELGEGVIDHIIANSHGDARAALNALEAACLLAEPDRATGRRAVTLDVAAEAMQKKALLYDKGGEEHYNVISAFIKSMRASDPHAAVYWLARMVEAGEDPLFIARRMVIFASEDVGNADPEALRVAVAVKEAVDFVGMPEGFIPLAQGATYLASALKSNASYMAYLEALEDVRKHGPLAVPMEVRNAPTALMKELGYSKGYKYPHSYSGAVVDTVCLPEALKGAVYYRPSTRGREAEIAARLDKMGRGGKKSGGEES